MITALESLRVDDVAWSALSAGSLRALPQLCKRITSLHLAYPFRPVANYQRLELIPCSAVA